MLNLIAVPFNYVACLAWVLVQQTPLKRIEGTERCLVYPKFSSSEEHKIDSFIRKASECVDNTIVGKKKI